MQIPPRTPVTPSDHQLFTRLGPGPRRFQTPQPCCRQLLVVLRDSRAQVLQVRADTFGPLPGPQPGVVTKDDSTLKKAVTFLEPIAELYAANKLQKEELVPYRNRLLKEQGLKAQRSKISKKTSSRQHSRRKKEARRAEFGFRM